MTCHRIGFPPISIMGLGRDEVSSLIRVPSPPARMTHFMNAHGLAAGACEGKPENRVLLFSLNGTFNVLRCGMPKRRDGIMTVRIPTDEKNILQALADQHDVTLSDVVISAVRDYIATHIDSLKKSASRSKNSPIEF